MSATPNVQVAPMFELRGVQPFAQGPLPHHDIFDPYTETYWLPIVGPTSWALGRRLAAWVMGGSVKVDRIELATSVGLRDAKTLSKTLGRMEMFGLVAVTDAEHISIYTQWPTLTRRQEMNLPLYLTEQHQALVAGWCSTPRGTVR